MEGQVMVKCHVCDMAFPFSHQAILTMKIPGTFCKRCYETFDMITLRQWFKLDMAIRQLQHQEQWLGSISAKTTVQSGDNLPG
jgi:hypothetical protein